MAEQDIHVKVDFDTSQATTALKGVTQAATQTAAATTKVGDATQAAQTKIGQYGSALGLAGQAVGKLNPALGGLVTMAGSATGVIQGLTTAGLGPLGIALSAISIAVSAGTSLWAEYSKEAKDSAKDIKEQVIPTLGDLVSKVQEANRAMSTRSRLAMGLGTSLEQEAFTRQAEQYAETVRQRRAALEQRGPEGSLSIGARLENERRYQAELERLRTEEARAEQVALYRVRLQNQAVAEEQDRANIELEQIREEAAKEAAKNQEEADRRNRTARVRAVRETTSDLVSAYADQTAFVVEQFNRYQEFLDQTMADEADVRARMRQQEIDESNAAKDRAIEVAAEQRDVLKALQDEQAALLQESTDAVFSSIQTAMQSSVDAMLDGSRSIGEAMQDMVKAIAKSLASEAIIQGLKQTALGISALAVGSPSAVGHFAAAGKWAAVGVAAGIVGAASGAFGGGGGGGGAPAAATGGPALTAGAREGAGTTVVINWGSSGLVYAADRAQLGRDISGMISEAHGRLGRGM